MEILIILFTIAYFILAWKRLDWAVMLLIAALPVYQIRFTVLGMPLTVLELMILIAFGVWAIWHTEFLQYIIKPGRRERYKKNKQQRRPYPFGREISLLLLISWIAMAVAEFSNSALGIWKAYFFEPALVFILVLNVFKHDTNDTNNTRIEFKFEKIIWPLCISALVMSLVAIGQKATGLWIVPEFWPRVTGVFSYPNALGLYLGPLVLLLIGWFIEQWKIFNFPQPRQAKRGRQFSIFKQFSISNFQLIITGITILLSILAIVFASSEGALAGILIAGFILGLYLFINKKLDFKWLLFSLIAIVFGFAIFSSLIFLKAVPEYKYWQIDNKILNYIVYKATLKDLSGEIRKQQWRETYAMLKQNGRWLLGTGLANYQTGIQPYHQEGIFFNKDNDLDFRQKIVWFDEKYKAQRWQPAEIYLYPHNILLNFWTELGIAGALLFIWIIGKYFYIGIRLRGVNHFIMSLVGSMVVIIVHGIVDVPYFKNDLAIIFWILIALMGLANISGELTEKNDK